MSAFRLIPIDPVAEIIVLGELRLDAVDDDAASDIHGSVLCADYKAIGSVAVTCDHTGVASGRANDLADAFT